MSLFYEEAFPKDSSTPASFPWGRYLTEDKILPRSTRKIDSKYLFGISTDPEKIRL